MSKPRIAIAAVLVLIAAAAVFAALYLRSTRTRLTAAPPGVPAMLAQTRLPTAPRHVVIIVEENKSYHDILGENDAPYIASLAKRAAVFTQSYGVAHPSQPNYIALFSGQTNTDGDNCAVSGVDAASPSLGGSLLRAHRTFTGYAESLPHAGFMGCRAGQYARKHAPWTHFKDVPASATRPFSDLRDYSKLPTVSFIIPNLLDDMHSASIKRADTWLQTNVDPLIRWAQKNDTLVILTWDESSAPVSNHIPTLFIGPMVRPGSYGTPITHYDVLRTIEEFYRLPALGASAHANPITDVWSKSSR